MNFEKTVVVWLGNRKNCGEKYLRNMNFIWDPGGEINSNFKYLGITFSTNVNDIIQLNYSSKLIEIEKLLKTWNRRFLTPYGKITVIKTLALSKLTYLFTNIPDPCSNFLKQVNMLFFKFLWNGKPNKIKSDYICQDYDEGGIRMVNVFDYLAYIKINCFKRYLCNEDIINLTRTMYPMMKHIVTMGSEYILKIMNTVKNPLLHDVLKHVKNLFDKIECVSFDDVIFESLFYNKNILVANKTVFYRSWANENVTQIYQLLTDTGEFLNFNEFITKYPNIVTNFLQYNGLVHSIKNYLRTTNIENDDDFRNNQEHEPVCWQCLRKPKYEIKTLISQRPKVEHSSIRKWNEAFSNLNWKRIFQICQKTTADNKIKWFQYRLIYRILPTNRFLCLRGIKNSSLCNLCQQSEETLTHMFWECHFVQYFWTELMNIFIRCLPHTHHLTLCKQLILFGYKENVITDKPFDLLVLAAKYHIYQCKFSNNVPNANLFLKQFKQRYKIEKYYNDSTSKDKFEYLWKPYELLLL